MQKINITTAEQALIQAIAWQDWQSRRNLSYGELADWASYFQELGEKFDLTEEYKENGII